jgi:thioredoxin 1
MPTFLFFKDGEKVDEFVGANPPALLNMLKQYNPEEAQPAETAEETAKSDAPEADLPK